MRTDPRVGVWAERGRGTRGVERVVRGRRGQSRCGGTGVRATATPGDSWSRCSHPGALSLSVCLGTEIHVATEDAPQPFGVSGRRVPPAPSPPSRVSQSAAPAAPVGLVQNLPQNDS